MNHNDAGRIDLISTHAPAGGATRFRPNGNGCRKLFLLTPLREGRRPRPSAPPACSVFLLTPLREGRPGLSANEYMETVFLLTPLREGRRSSGSTSASGAVFLLTPLREGRPTRRNFPLSAAVFLLTPLREGRLILLSRPRRITYFYSRPCGRGDNCTAAPVLHGRISTHAPAGGATRGRMKRLRLFLLFLLTPLREGRRHHAHDGRYNLHISTHAPAGGATLPAALHGGGDLHFYSRPCGRGDGALCSRFPVVLHFYSRPCGRGDRR